MAARTLITGVSATYAGTTMVMGAVDAANGNKVAGSCCGGLLLVANGGASAIEATIKSNGYSIDGMVVGDRVVTVGDGDSVLIKIPAGRSAKQSDTFVYFDWSDGTSVTAAVINP